MPAPLHFLLTTFGSAGDLMPLLSLGQTLQGRGHRVTVLTGGGFMETVRHHGLEGVPLAPPEFFQRSLRDVFLLNTRYHGLFLKRYAVAWNAALVRRLSEVKRENTIVLGAERPLVWGDLCAHLHHGLSCVRVVTDLMPAPGVRDSDQTVNPRRQAALAADWQAAWGQAAQSLQIASGHRHVARLTQASNRSVPRLALWPEWIVPHAPRPANLKPFGFVGGPTPCSTTSPAPLRPAAGRRLLVFMAGTVGTLGNWETRFTEVSRQVCARLGCDGLLLGGTAPDGATPCGTFAWRRHAPLDEVLPSAAALIHHGGIGTAAAALQHGIPQLIVPRMFSQPSNARWMEQAGVARVLAPDEYYAAGATHAVTTLLADDALRDRCGSARAKVDPRTDRGRVCDFVEEWHRRRIAFLAAPSEKAVRVPA